MTLNGSQPPTASSAAKVIGGAAQWQRHAEGSERRQQPVEKRRVFDGKQSRQPAVAAIVDDERRLQAGEVVAGAAEGGEGLAELRRMRPILGVVDRDEGAAGKGQGEGQRLRLGTRSDGRDKDDLVLPIAACGPGGGDRGGVVGFQNDLDIKTVARPVELVEGRDQIGDNRGLVIEGHQHGVDRKFGIRHAGWRRGDRARGGAGESGSDKPQHGHAEEESGADEIERHQRGSRVGGKSKHHRRGDDQCDSNLGSRGDAAGGKVGVEDCQVVNRVVGKLLTARLDQGGTDRGGRRHTETEAHLGVAMQPTADRRHGVLIRRRERQAIAFRRQGESAATDCREVGQGARSKVDRRRERQSEAPSAIGIDRRFAIATRSTRPTGRIAPAHPAPRRAKRLARRASIRL